MFERTLSRIEPAAYTAFRVVTGGLLVFHGLQKLFGVFTTHARQAPFTQAWLGGVIELSCGVLVALGLFTRYAAFLASGTMAVAYIQFHWKLHGGKEILPIVNGGELAVVYCFAFFFIACRGAGPHALGPHRR